MTTSKNARLFSSLLVLMLLAAVAASAQITPSADVYTNSADPTTNYGAATTLAVDGAKEAAYIQFNLSSIPTGASVSQATLKLYVNAVTIAGSYQVYSVNGAWSESTTTYDLAPALGSVIDSGVALTAADKNQYILIPMTSTVEEWVNTPSSNNGIALVAIGSFNASFDSKENTTTSHPPELDIVFAGDGTITGVTTASGSGLRGGGTSGTLNLSLTNACAANQVLQWNGSSWACASLTGGGTITGVTAGTDLTGGGTSGKVTLNLNTANVPQLNTANTFTGNQTVNGNLSATGTVTGSSFGIGSNLFAFGSYANQNSFLGFAGNTTTTGNLNTAAGYQSLSSNTTGSGNSAYGVYALQFNTTGFANTANGYQALYPNTTGYANTASGSQALSSNTTGVSNTASGFDALQSNATGNQNTAFGYQALVGNTGDSSGDGTANTGIGQQALQYNTTGNYNTALGYKAGPDKNSPNLANATAIGANAVVSESNALVLGSGANVGIGTATPLYTLDVHGTGNFTGAVKFASSQQFPGTITGVTTASGSGLNGGGTGGTLNLSLTNACAANQVLQWNGSSWACASLTGGGTITGVTAGTDLTGGGTTGKVTVNLDTTKIPQLNASNIFSGNQMFQSGYVEIFSNSNFALEVVNQTSGQGNGITASNQGSAGAGLLGISSSLSNTGSTYNNATTSSGIWADNNNTAIGVRQALLATADDASAIFAVNESPSGYPTIWAVQNGSGSNAISGFSSSGVGVDGGSSTGNGVSGNGVNGVYGSGSSNGVYGTGTTTGVYGLGSNYGVFSYGNIGATGTKTAVVALPDDRVVSLYAMESPENWFEDFGSNQLSGGVASIELDATFAQTVSPEMGYHVFITPNGDCEGLFVAQRTATGFEVRELRGGKSNVAFDYRIVAKRKGLEMLRMENVGADHDTAEAIRQQLSLRASHSPKFVLPKLPEHAKAQTSKH
jgi:hypothetical protein